MTEKLNLSLGIITISDTRTLDDDFSGLKIAELAEASGIKLSQRLVVKDDIAAIREAFPSFSGLDILITNGGTGIAMRDVTLEALQPMIQTEIPGFGELFRLLSYQDIGSHAMASRAVAFFTQQGQLVFALPGSTSACELAMQKLILPEIYHLIKERRK